MRGAKSPPEAEVLKRVTVHEANLAGPWPFRAPVLNTLIERLRELPDTRRGHGLRHRQPFVLAAAAVCTWLGASGYRSLELVCGSLPQRRLATLGCPQQEDGKRHSPSDSMTQDMRGDSLYEL